MHSKIGCINLESNGLAFVSGGIHPVFVQNPKTEEGKGFCLTFLSKINIINSKILIVNYHARLPIRRWTFRAKSKKRTELRGEVK